MTDYRKVAVADGGEMKTVSFKLSPAVNEEIEAEADEVDQSKSAYIRGIIQERDRAAELEREVESLEAKLDELQNQLMAANQRIDSANEVVRYVEEKQTWRSAGAATRLKWWLFGRDETAEG